MAPRGTMYHLEIRRDHTETPKLYRAFLAIAASLPNVGAIPPSALRADAGQQNPQKSPAFDTFAGLCAHNNTGVRLLAKSRPFCAGPA